MISVATCDGKFSTSVWRRPALGTSKTRFTAQENHTNREALVFSPQSGFRLEFRGANDDIESGRAALTPSQAAKIIYPRNFSRKALQHSLISSYTQKHLQKNNPSELRQ
jgi:hypothetical protein